MKKSYLVLPLFACFLTACAQTPNNFVIAPVMEYKAETLYLNKQAQLTVTDLRSNSHTLQILREGEAAELFSSNALLSSVIENELTTTLKKHGLNIAVQSINDIEVFIDKTKISVQQTLMNYQATSEISLRVKVKNGQQTLTKNFASKGKSKGPLKSDIGVLERDFNRQLGNLLIKISKDPEINQFIK